MIQTSYFKQPGLYPDAPRLVSIALWAPRGYRGRRYSPLAPRREMFKMGESAYSIEYQKILDNLDPAKVAKDLGPDAIMLCWERPGEFCHRRLVAEWLEKHLGQPVPEFDKKLFEWR